MSSLAAHFAVSAPVTTPLTFAGSVGGWFENLAYAQIDTPEKRAALVSEAMAVYDAAGVALGKKRPLIGAAFGAARGSIESLLAGGLEALANVLAPPPVPTPVAPQPSPIGAAE